MKITIKESNGRSKVIGEIVENNGIVFFKKSISIKKHLYKKLNAIGLDADKFTRVILPQVDYITVYDKDKKQFYATKPEVYEKFGEYLTFPPHRSQIFLARDYFRKFDNEWKQIEDFCPECIMFLKSLEKK